VAIMASATQAAAKAILTTVFIMTR